MMMMIMTQQRLLLDSLCRLALRVRAHGAPPQHLRLLQNPQHLHQQTPFLSNLSNLSQWCQLWRNLKMFQMQTLHPTLRENQAT
jgi:hypothetical protein